MFLLTVDELLEKVGGDAGMVIRQVDLAINDKELETFLLRSQLGPNFLRVHLHVCDWM